MDEEFDIPKIDEFLDGVEYIKKRGESQDLNELYGALAKAQKEMTDAKMDRKNPYFKSTYADLSSVVKASRPALTAQGLCVIQRLTQDDGKIVLSSRMGHSSGQWIESVIRVNPPKPDIQTLGSYITYLRRYTYAALVGVVASGEDDDGESAMKGFRNGKVTMEKISDLEKIRP